MLSKETVQTIVNYLQTKPYAEVYQIIAKIFTEVKPVETVPEAPKAE